MDVKDSNGRGFVEKNPIRIELVKNGNSAAANTQPQEPATKSVRRWFVVLASFTCNGLIFGLINSVSVIYNELQKNLEESGVENASTKACE
ncbi:hypothetical protein RUM44_013335 [Polyplax serrata]|uniref:Uncharacterized protein n=1 Tax=Polyplax serrata TaxID=468196 RepID=A0ABR1BG32_POLSC